MIENEYDPKSNEIMKHESTLEENELVEERKISLEDCLQQFHAVEKLTEQVYCSHCEEHTNSQKSLQNFRPPPVLIIQLKRFKQIDGQMRKLQTLVDFPIYNLDLSPFVQDFEFLSKLDISCQYDLSGMVNHYGSLTFGHYISVVKNPYEEMWYKYDDQNRIPTAEDQIAKENAYILFYVRKDVKNKKVEDLLPSILEIFPGKPVKCK